MEFGDILTYRQTSGTATWNDSEGDYGVLKCMEDEDYFELYKYKFD